MKICFATNNLHKLDEVRHLLGGSIDLVGLKDIGCEEELPEEQDTLEGNSLQKAQYVFDNYGVSCFADDTGLEVEALGGAPGVYSARYAGEQRKSDDNIELLLKNLADKNNRKARFRTVFTLVTPSITKQFEGIVEGEILKVRRGDGGFGYDPIFLPAEVNQTMAELSMEAKNEISHRGRATRKLVEYLRSQTGSPIL